MSDRPMFRKGQISAIIHDALGGTNSPIREPITVQLGNPSTGDVYVPEDIRQYEGQVWLSDRVGDFPRPDTDDTERDDSPSGLYMAFLPSGALPSGRRKFGTTVKAVWTNGRYEVLKDTIEGANYNKGVPENEHSPVKVKEIDYGLIRATDPPTGRVVLSESIHPGPTNWEQLVLTTSEVDLIAQYASDLTQGKAKAIKVEADPSDHSIVYTEGTAFTSTARDVETGAVDHAVVFSNYPRTVESNRKLYGWVYLYFNQTVITEQDLLPVPDYGIGGSGGSAQWEAGESADLPEAPGDLIGFWDYETGDVWMRNGSEPAGWLGPYNLPSIGGGGALSSGYKLRGSGDGIGNGTDAKLTYSDIIYDTDGYYDSGTNTQTPATGRWQHTAWVSLAVNDTTSGAGYIRVFIVGEYGGELPINLVDQTILTPSGLTDSIVLGFNIVTIGNVATPNEFELRVENFSGEDVTVQGHWIEGTLLGDQLATP